MTTTWNGANSYSDCGSARISLFFKGVKGLDNERLEKYIDESLKESFIDTLLIIINMRDCRGGKGERELGRHALSYFARLYPLHFQSIIKFIPEYGRWDDLTYIAEHCNNGYVKNECYSFIAKTLIEDKQKMKLGLPCTICAKWTPTEGDSFDRKYHSFSTLAKTLGIPNKKLRVDFNSPLRSYLDIVERYLCTKDWSSINYSKVPSYAMKNLRKTFEKHDQSRFLEWKSLLSQGKVKVNAKQLYPHDLIKCVLGKNYDSIIEEQWKILSSQTKLKNCLSVVDVSGSMLYGKSVTPLHVAIALGLLICENNEGTFHNRVITFHDEPNFESVEGETLQEKVTQMINMPWGGSTDLEKVFRLILEKCSNRMDVPEKIFIISDMQFNSCTGNVTNWENIKSMYNKAGYNRPEIVFWNVNGSSDDFPVTVNEDGVCLISGFSPSILKSLCSDGTLNSMNILRKCLDDIRYELIVKELY